MTVDEYLYRVRDSIIGLERRSLTKSSSQSELEQIIQGAYSTLVNSKLTDNQIQEFWKKLREELTVTRKQANSALLAILAAAEQVIAQQQSPKRK